ncbi:MAG TPA: hypothetical protein VF979_10060 [Streptosporangiaceae bacterium]
MTRPHLIGAIALAGVVLAVAGCAASSPASSRSPQAVGPVTVPLAAGVMQPGASWATVQTGGPSVGGRFWQLLTEDQATGKWRLVTPPGVADNAGLAVTRAPDGTMTVGFVPGQLLKFSPLATTTDDGAHWAQALLPAGLVHDPDSLAALPDGGLVAVTTTAVEKSAAGAKNWAPLVTLRTLAATPDGRRCGLTGLTGTVAVPGGSLLVSGTCSRVGQLGLFSNVGGRWRATYPWPSRTARFRVSWGNVLSVTNHLLDGAEIKPEAVLGMISSAAGVSVLVDAVTSHGQDLIASWLAAGAKTWTFNPPRQALAGVVTAVSGSGNGAWVVMLNGRRMVTAGPAPKLNQHQVTVTWGVPFRNPGPDATIVPSGDGAFTALVPGVSTITVWQWPASGGWHRTRTIDVASAPAGQSS